MELFNNFRDITLVVENQLCLSCGACDPICPTNTISFFETPAGHIFPKINYDGCIDCTLCLQVCPGVGFSDDMINQIPTDPFIGNVISVNVGKSSNNQIYKNSQSGGIVTELVYQALKNGEVGAVIVAEMQEQNHGNPRAKGIVVTNPEDLLKSQKSKYVPIPLLRAIREIEKLDVDFGIVGVSCHIHGLIRTLEKKRKLKKRLKFKIGLVCDRVMTYGGMEFLINQSNVKGKITEFIFRDKAYIGYPGEVKIKSKNKLKYLSKSERMRIKDFFTPTRCRICFDKMNIFSDLTVGDPHQINNIDREMGESLIITRTKIGQKLLTNYTSVRKIKDDYTIGQLIDPKKKDWLAYLNLFKERGFILPNYIKIIKSNLKVDPNNVSIQLDAGNNLFKTTNRNKLQKSIRNKLMIQRVLKLKVRVLSKILNVFQKLKLNSTNK